MVFGAWRKLTIDDSVIATLRPIQNKTGGFGGGHGQFSHLATTYASTLSLVMVGGEEALDLIDRQAMSVTKSKSICEVRKSQYLLTRY